MAGGATDCRFWERLLSWQCPIYELCHKERISVAAASKLLADMVYQYKGMGGPGLYYVDSEGNQISGATFSVGSGSVYAYGVMNQCYSYDLEVEQAYDLTCQAIYQATYRDDGWMSPVTMYLHEKYSGSTP
uniref:Proteasome subunit beta type-5 n=1 Tax=Cebus imitator TaxID=2715852 RepID=A0A2K5QB46_CEBIM